jgi:hypothetical protein
MIVETAYVDGSLPSERGRGGVIVTSMAIHKNGIVGGVACIGRFQYHKCISRSGCRIVLCKIDRFCNHVSLTESDTCVDTNSS